MCWGRTDNGQCNVPSPNTDFIGVSVHARYSLGLKSDGSIVAWGCGDGDFGQCDVPVPNTDFVAIAAGLHHALGLKSDSSVVAWGRNDAGQCNVPEPNSGFVAIAAAEYHNLGIATTSTAVPTVSEWGLVAMTLLMLTAGTVVYTKRKPTTT